MKRRHWFGVGALLLTVALVAWPSSAAGSRSRFTGKGANASWYLGDPLNTAVFLGIFDGTNTSSTEGTQSTKDVFVSVYQSFCDTESNTWVDREYFTYEPATGTALSISKKLDTASVSGSVNLVGVEFRTPDCDEPDYENSTYTDLGEFSKTIAATWSGAGGVARNSYHFSYSPGPGCKFSSRGATRSRSATASGSLEGDVTVGDLGVSEYGEIFQTRDMYRDVDRSCFIE